MAQETKFTPGPWRVEEGTTLVWGACNSDDDSSYGMGFPVADAVTDRAWSRRPRLQDEEREANAQLIAAAPELYEALQEAQRYIAELVRPKADSPSILNAWAQGVEIELKCRKALAKARGETPCPER